MLQLTVQEMSQNIFILLHRTYGTKNRRWKWEILFDFLFEETLKTIASFEVQQSEQLEDQIIWDSLGHGDFSSKSTLSLIEPIVDIEENQVWSCIWKLQAPQRIKFFSMACHT